MQQQRAARPLFQVSVIAVMLFEIAALFARSALELRLASDGFSRPVAKDLSYLVVPPLLFTLMYPYLRRNKAALSSLFKPSAITARLVLLSIALGLILRITYWAVVTLLIWCGVIHNEEPGAFAGPLIGFQCQLASVALSLAVVSLLIPLIEETINRGFLLHVLLPRGDRTAIVISALLFALMHLPATYPTAFAVGLLFAIQTLNYGTLWAPVVAHASFNAATVFDWECFRIVWNPPASDPTLAKAALLAAPTAVLGTLLAAFIVSRKAAGTC
jgi:membrane protease YdiL (CAAX protease family)